jgi:hypothetical protein
MGQISILSNVVPEMSPVSPRALRPLGDLHRFLLPNARRLSNDEIDGESFVDRR